MAMRGIRRRRFDPPNEQFMNARAHRRGSPTRRARDVGSAGRQNGRARSSDGVLPVRPSSRGQRRPPNDPRSSDAPGGPPNGRSRHGLRRRTGDGRRPGPSLAPGGSRRGSNGQRATAVAGLRRVDGRGAARPGDGRTLAESRARGRLSLCTGERLRPGADESGRRAPPGRRTAAAVRRRRTQGGRRTRRSGSSRPPAPDTGSRRRTSTSKCAAALPSCSRRAPSSPSGEKASNAFPRTGPRC